MIVQRRIRVGLLFAVVFCSTGFSCRFGFTPSYGDHRLSVPHHAQVTSAWCVPASASERSRFSIGRTFVISSARVSGEPRTPGSPRNRCQSRKRRRSSARASRQKRFAAGVVAKSSVVSTFHVTFAHTAPLPWPTTYSDRPATDRSRESPQRSPQDCRQYVRAARRGNAIDHKRACHERPEPPVCCHWSGGPFHRR